MTEELRKAISDRVEKIRSLEGKRKRVAEAIEKVQRSKGRSDVGNPSISWQVNGQTQGVPISLETLRTVWAIVEIDRVEARDMLDSQIEDIAANMLDVPPPDDEADKDPF